LFTRDDDPVVFVGGAEDMMAQLGHDVADRFSPLTLESEYR
jgi:hypothetical protein